LEQQPWLTVFLAHNEITRKCAWLIKTDSLNLPEAQEVNRNGQHFAYAAKIAHRYLGIRDLGRIPGNFGTFLVLN
jgi:hypothetical protein